MTAKIDFGLDFASSADRIRGEKAERKALIERELRFNVRFLDDALGGILPNDLIVLGAQTGAGKTALASAIAQENAKAGRRVTYFALEAEPKEIERRAKYRLMASLVFERGTPAERARLSYRNWYRGELDDVFDPVEREAEERLTREMRLLTTYYRGLKFTGDDLVRTFLAVQDQTDLIVLDHLHYVDSDEPNENRAYKDIVKRVRDICLTIGKPVILIAHLRKKDRNSKALVPSIDDFHGSSDITKIATKAILLAPAKIPPPEKETADERDRRLREATYFWPTFMYVAKDRMDGGVSKYLAAVMFDARKNAYERRYLLGRNEEEQFVKLKPEEIPVWARRSQ